MEAVWSSSRWTVASRGRSPSLTYTCSERAEAFQSTCRRSSPGRYWRCSRKSAEGTRRRDGRWPADWPRSQGCVRKASRSSRRSTAKSARSAATAATLSSPAVLLRRKKSLNDTPQSPREAQWVGRHLAPAARAPGLGVGRGSGVGGLAAVLRRLKHPVLIFRHLVGRQLHR